MGGATLANLHVNKLLLGLTLSYHCEKQLAKFLKI